ncbi:hypothetical protein [Nonomuraea glycinis]|uniref:hypothetical protein n=1 Tax=Nonomuraea glycinis TaxID=2047744 RepID=UPI002E16853A|nr:hypothetical protein OHA68_43310 [Nonomuraea glycinis]
MIEPVDPTTLPLCRYCGERLRLVDGRLEAVYGGSWDPWIPVEECRGRRIVGEFKFEGHILSTLSRPAAR